MLEFQSKIPLLSRQPFIQFRQKRLEFIAKERMTFAETALLAEPAVLEVIGLEDKAGGDVFGHTVEPVELLFGKNDASASFN